MPGVVFIEGSRGMCGWHAREPGQNWPHITQVILDWECISGAIRRARSVLTAPDTCADPKAQDAALRREWEAMLPTVQGSGWKSALEPAPREQLGQWMRGLERFLEARIRASA